MLKLLLCSAVIAPCFFVAFTGAAKSEMVTFQTTSFEEALVEPEFKNLENCKTAELDVFFHENYVTSHSADYLAHGINLSKNCGNATYTITPIIPSTSYVNAEDVLGPQTEELSLMLEAHGVDAQISRADEQDEYNTLSANGRTAKIKITFSDNRKA